MRRCLAKDPDARWSSARELCDQLRRIVEKRSRRWAIRMVAAAAALVPLVALALRLALPKGVPAAPVRFELSPPSPRGGTGAGRGLAFLSPDGRRLVWMVSNQQRSMSLAVQDLDSLSIHYLDDTDRAGLPFWSPDSRNIAFFAGGQLKRVSASGGAVQTIAAVQRPAGGCWSERDTIVFAPDLAGPLFRIASRGGAAAPVTTLDRSRGEIGHRWPSCLPHGYRFIYSAAKDDVSEADLWVGSVNDHHRTWLTTSHGGAVYAGYGIVLLLRGTQLLAQPVNDASDAIVGQPIVIERVAHRAMPPGPPYFSAAANGTWAWHTLQATKTTLTWFDRSGRRQESVGNTDTFRDPALSPDGRFLAVQRYEFPEGRTSVRLMDLDTRTSVRLKADVDVMGAIWSPDGRELLIGCSGAGKYFLSRVVTADGGDHVVLEGTRPLLPTDWSTDGRFVAFETTTSASGYDIGILDLTGQTPAHAYVQSSFNETKARFSADGHWVAYASNETGRYEVYVEPFHRTGERWRISPDGGDQPRWRHDGKELYYLSATRRLMATTLALGTRVTPERTEALFDLPFQESTDSLTSFNVSDQGQRFLVNAIAALNRSSIHATVVVNGVRLAER